MAKTVKIKYNRPSLYRCGSLRLESGINEVRVEFWDEAKDNPGVKKRVESGEISVIDEKTSAKAVATPAKPETPEEPSDAGLDALNELSIANAKEVIKETFDHKTLKRWQKKETRKAVLAAIDKHLYEFSDKSNAT
ncbi:hypothetical protein HY641_03400 [Candidatus Woesearchaeota archaeon]|nr:hypothetical protein [Candidatus Woesearchaeota archaeon]